MSKRGMPDGLSVRAQQFLLRWRGVGHRVVGSFPDTPEWAQDVVQSYAREFGGLVFPILGGELEGWIRLGVRSGKVWAASPTEWVFTCAEPEFVQCGLVRRLDGYFGVSWSGEFLPWHSDIRRLIESSAIWEELVGWSRVALLEGKPSDVVSSLGSLAVAPESASAETSWWMGDEVAVYAEPYLTYLPEGVSRIHVMAAGERPGYEVRKALEKTTARRFRELTLLGADSIGEPGACPFGG